MYEASFVNDKIVFHKVRNILLKNGSNKGLSSTVLIDYLIISQQKIKEAY